MRWALLMLMIPAASLAACGGAKKPADTPASQVRAYLRQVNANQVEARPAFKRADKAYAAFAKGKLKPADAVARLRRSDIDVRAVRDHLAALQPPAPAQTLAAKMRAYYARVLDFTRELAVLAAYQQSAAIELRGVPRYNRELSRHLKTAKTPARQAALLGRFARQVGHVVDGLQALDVPSVLRVSHGDQVRRLRSTQSLSLRLRSALLARDSVKVGRLLERFQNGATGRQPRTKLARAAIQAYNDRYHALNRAYADVFREYRRLNRAVR